MSRLADALRAALVPFIVTIGGLLLALLLALVVERGIRAIAARRAERRRRQCRPLVEAWLAQTADPAALERLVRVCQGRRRDTAAELLLAPLRSVRGDLVERSREALTRLGLCDAWRAALRDRRWWRRARAAQALGLSGERAAAAALVALLDDDSGEVRASAIEALGRIGDPATLPPLVAALVDARHQRVRVVAALRAFGASAAEEVVRWASLHPAVRPVSAEVLGQIGSAVALDPLTAWTDDPDPSVRAAAHRAIGDIGPDERAYYFALRALADTDPTVRAMAARAVGRSGRTDATPYLAAHLADVGAGAAQSAAALKQLGEAGRAALAAAATAGGPGADLARQMIWELQP